MDWEQVMQHQDRQEEMDGALEVMGLTGNGNVDIVKADGMLEIDMTDSTDEIKEAVKADLKDDIGAMVKEHLENEQKGKEVADTGLEVFGLDISEMQDRVEQPKSLEDAEPMIRERVVVQESSEARQNKGLKHVNRKLIRLFRSFGELIKLIVIAMILAVVIVVVGETYYAQVANTQAPAEFVAYSDFIKMLLGQIVDIAKVFWVKVKDILGLMRGE